MIRTAGPTLSPFNAWVFLKGLETLELRMQAHSANALRLAQWLEERPEVDWVLYPGLPSHPRHDLVGTQMRSGGGIVAFQVKGGREAAWRLIDSTRLLSITANLGDTKSTITHPASTTHRAVDEEARAEMGITDGMLRLSVGLEDVRDLIEDMEQAIKT